MVMQKYIYRWLCYGCGRLLRNIYKPKVLFITALLCVVILFLNINQNKYDPRSVDRKEDMSDGYGRKLDGMDKYQYDDNREINMFENFDTGSRAHQPNLNVNSRLEADSIQVLDKFIKTKKQYQKNDLESKIGYDVDKYDNYKKPSFEALYVDNEKVVDSDNYLWYGAKQSNHQARNKESHQYEQQNNEQWNINHLDTRQSKARHSKSEGRGSVHIAVVVNPDDRFPATGIEEKVHGNHKHHDVYPGREVNDRLVLRQETELHRRKLAAEDAVKNATKTTNIRQALLKKRLSAKDKRKDIRKCNKVRMQRLRNRCKDLEVNPLEKHNDTEILRLAKYIITDDKHHVLINTLPKTGCSSWKMVMLNNSGMNIEKPGQRPNGGINNWKLLNNYGLKDLGDYPVEDIRYRLQEYFTILTVRHPFERLESAYREKFIRENKIYKDKISHKIIAKYRNVEEVNKPSVNGTVNFEEFLRYTLEANNVDRHWTPYWQLANPCILPYKYVAKTETANRDMDYIAATKLSYGVSGGGYQYNPTQTEEQVQIHSSKVLPLFSELKPETQEELLMQLLDKYMDDMELFGYRIRKDKANNIIADCEMYSPEGMCC